MEEVPDIKNDVNLDSFTRFPRLMLRMVFVSFGPLPSGATRREQRVFRAKRIYNKFQFAFYFLCIVSRGASVVNSESLLERSQVFLDVVAFILQQMKVVLFVWHKDKIWEIFEDLKKLFNDENPDEKKEKVKNYLHRHRILTRIYAFPTTMIIIMNLLPIFPYLFFGKMKLFFDYWYPFDPYQLHTFPFAFFWVNWTLESVGMSLMAAETMLFSIITIVVMEFDILKENLTKMFDYTGQERRKRVQQLVDRHQALLEICERIQESFSLTFLLNFLVSSIVMCFVTFQLSTIENDFLSCAFYLNYLVVISAQILLLCFYGQKLTNASEEVYQGVYDCGWEDSSDETTKKQLIPIILRAQKGKRLSALYFADISLETYTRVSLTTRKLQDDGL